MISGLFVCASAEAYVISHWSTLAAIMRAAEEDADEGVSLRLPRLQKQEHGVVFGLIAMSTRAFATARLYALEILALLARVSGLSPPGALHWQHELPWTSPQWLWEPHWAQTALHWAWCFWAAFTLLRHLTAFIDFERENHALLKVLQVRRSESEGQHIK